MDSKKALRIIIALMLIVNIFMAGYIISLAFSEPDTKDEHKYITDILAYRDIVLDCEIPDYSAPSAVIIPNSIDNTAIIDYLKEQDGTIVEQQDGMIMHSPISTERYENFTLEIATTITDAFIKELPLENEAYMLDSILTAGVNMYRFDYIYLDGSSYIYDKRIEITVSKNGIDQVYIKSLEYTVSDTEYNRPMVTIGNILVSSFTRQGQSFITIKKIDTGYLYNKNTSSIANVWRVMYNNGQERYFSSVDGTEIIQD